MTGQNTFETVERVTATLSKGFQANLERDQKLLLAGVADHGGVHQYLESQFPRVARAFLPNLTEEGLLAENLAYYRGAEERLALCESCPSYGGGCQDHQAAVPIGHLPVVQDGVPIATLCDRWPEFRIRRRLMQFGVPELISGATVSGVSTRWTTNSRTKFATLTRTVLDRFASGPFAVLVGSGNSEMGVAILREVLKAHSKMAHVTRGLWARFVDVARLAQDMKTFMSDEKHNVDPFLSLALEDVEFLVVDGFMPHRTPAWLGDKLELVLRERFRNQRATLILSDRYERERDNAFYLTALRTQSLEAVLFFMVAA